jgi:nucleoside-diphosphate-sugar epimerase
MKVIVTGASGFLGSELTKSLVADGYEVIAIARRPIEQLPEIRQKKLSGAKYLSVDLGDTSALEAELNKVCKKDSLLYVFHLAWWGEDGLSDLNISKQSQNILNTVNLFHLSKKFGVKSFIFAGTMEEEFALEYTRLDFNIEKKYNRHVVYALAKIATRSALKHSYSENGPNIIFATNSHIMGPGDEKDSFLQVALLKILNGETLNMSSGEQIFDVIDVRDCANAYKNIAKFGKNGVSYWVGSGEPCSLRHYVEIMNQTYGPVKINYSSVPFEDIKLSPDVFSTADLVNDTNFVPEITFDKSVDTLAKYLLQAG